MSLRRPERKRSSARATAICTTACGELTQECFGSLTIHGQVLISQSTRVISSPGRMVPSIKNSTVEPSLAASQSSFTQQRNHICLSPGQRVWGMLATSPETGSEQVRQYVPKGRVSERIVLGFLRVALEMYQWGASSVFIVIFTSHHGRIHGWKR